MNTIRKETDVLIIGGGAAGMWTANRFTDLQPDKQVLIVDKGPKDWGGLMSMAGGDFDAVLPEENVEDWLKEFVYYFDGLCDQDLMKAILEISYDRLTDYESYGCEFFHKEDGTRKSIPQRGLDHVKLYPAQKKGRGGEQMVKSLVAQLKKKNVERIGRVMLTDLLKQGDHVVGAVGFDTRNGDFYVINAQVVVMATGMGGWKTSYGKNTPTGEGAQMAFRAGAHLKDFEFSRVWNMPNKFGWEGQTALMPLGARFVNKEGESFMERYSPVLKANTDPHFTTIAMAMEIRENKGPISFDISNIKPENMVLLKPQDGWQKLNYDKLSNLGMDLFRDNTIWVPQMTVSYGGMEAGIHGETNVPGLFATGTARSTEPGVYAGGFALMSTACTGYLTGEGVAAYLADAEPITFTNDEAWLEAYSNYLFAPIGKQGVDPKEVLTEIQTIMFPYDVAIVKNQRALEQALEKLTELKKTRIPQMVAKDAHYLLKLKEVEAVAFISELYLRASLERKETRAGHYREDYPQRDDQYLSWLLLSKGEDNGIEMSWKPVPLEKYPYPIERYYSDNFTFIKHD